jgi:hypothetical protein
LYDAASFATVVVFPTPVGPTKAMVRGRPSRPRVGLGVSVSAGINSLRCRISVWRTITPSPSSAAESSSRTRATSSSAISAETSCSIKRRYICESASGMLIGAPDGAAAESGPSRSAVCREHCRTCPTIRLIAASSASMLGEVITLEAHRTSAAMAVVTDSIAVRVATATPPPSPPLGIAAP